MSTEQLQPAETPQGAASELSAGLAGTRCEYCDGSGDVHNKVGEFLGFCNCGAPSQLCAVRPDTCHEGFDDVFCECQTAADEEELASNHCKSCGKQII